MVDGTLVNVDEWMRWTASEMAGGRDYGDTDLGRTDEDCAADLAHSQIGELAARAYLFAEGWNYRPHEGWEHDGVLVDENGREHTVDVKTRKGWAFGGDLDLLLRGSYQAESDIYIQVVLVRSEGVVECADVRAFCTAADVAEHRTHIAATHKPGVPFRHLRRIDNLADALVDSTDEVTGDESVVSA